MIFARKQKVKLTPFGFKASELWEGSVIPENAQYVYGRRFKATGELLPEIKSDILNPGQMVETHKRAIRENPEHARKMALDITELVLLGYLDCKIGLVPCKDGPIVLLDMAVYYESVKPELDSVQHVLKEVNA